MILDEHGNPVSMTVSGQKAGTLEDMRAKQRRDHDYIRGSVSYYDAAQKAREDRPAHWSAADNLSSAAANSPQVRKVLRKHVRYEVANNSYAEGIVQTDANYVINKGPKIQFRPPADADQKTIDECRRAERKFNQWMRHRRINLPKTLRTAWRARLQDGEPFIQLSTTDRPVQGISLKPELVECDRIESPMEYYNNPKWEYGIKYQDGEPVAYAVLKYHPGDSLGIDLFNGSAEKSTEVPAEKMIHWFAQTRPEQKRGVPMLTPALPLYEHLRRWTMATISSAETAASISLYLKTNQPPGDGPAPLQPMDTFPIERNMMITMPEGWEPHQVQGTHPDQSYKEFKREIVTEMARCLSMPFNIAGCDSSEYNYASGRLDHQTYFNRVGVDEDDCLIHVVTPIAEAWLEEAKREFSLAINVDDIEVDAFWGGRKHVDPSKVANANEKFLKTGQTTLDETYAERGLDFETEMERAAQTLGISVNGYKRLIMGNLFKMIENNDKNNRTQASEFDEINNICARYDSYIPEETLELHKLQALAGDLTAKELESKLSKV